jgi:hypothetical protein
MAREPTMAACPIAEETRRDETKKRQTAACGFFITPQELHINRKEFHNFQNFRIKKIMMRSSENSVTSF